MIRYIKMLWGYIWPKRCVQCKKRFFGHEPFWCPDCAETWRRD